MATPRPFPVDPKLTGIALAYRNSDYIADIIMPRVKVPSSTFRYRTYEKGQYLTPPNTLVGRKSEPNQVELGYSELSSYVFDYGLDDVIPYDDIINAPEGYDPMAEATEYLAELLAVDREKRVRDIVFNDASYATGCKATLTGTAQFSHADSDPLDTLLTALEVPFARPNTVVMGRDVWVKLCRNTSLLQTVYPNANGNGVITPEQLAQILDVERVLVGRTRINTAKRGANANISNLWDKHVALLYIDPAATVSSRLTWGITAEFGNRVSGVLPEPDKGLRGASKVRVGESVRELVLANEAGYFIKNAVA